MDASEPPRQDASRSASAPDIRELVERSRSVWGHVTIELGCGPEKRSQESIGIDIRPFDGVDIAGDALANLRSLDEASVDRVQSWHFLEHVEEFEELILECDRVLRSGGTFEAVVPHFSNPYFYSDPTHRRTFGLYTFLYLISEDNVRLRREVPTYIQNPGQFALERIHICFKSPRPRYLRYALKKIWELIVNSSTWTQEFYEEILCWMCPAYEIGFVMRRLER